MRLALPLHAITLYRLTQNKKTTLFCKGYESAKWIQDSDGRPGLRYGGWRSGLSLRMFMVSQESELCHRHSAPCKVDHHVQHQCRSTLIGCRTVRPEPCSIWWRQLVPQAAICSLALA